MARALVCQATGDYLGMADALGYWRDDSALDGHSRMYAVLWRPLLVEGLVGSGQPESSGVSRTFLYSNPQAAPPWPTPWQTPRRGRHRTWPAGTPSRRRPGGNALSTPRTY
jgi:hypothetical protein